MTTIRQLVTDGFRESGLIEVGGIPDADEFEEGLRKLNTVFKSLFGNELGDPLVPVNYGLNGLTNSYAKSLDSSSVVNASFIPVNVRLILNIDTPVTLYLHPNPQDGARLGLIDNIGNFATENVTLNGNGRTIENTGSVVLSTDSVNREWFYRADLANWVRVIDLVAEDDSPLPVEFDDFLTTLLAFRLNPRYGAVTNTDTIEVTKRIKKFFSARYRQTSEQSSEYALIRLPSNRYWQIMPSSLAFDRGRP
jgi:hypothetical protein